MIATVTREKAIELLEHAVQLKGEDYVDENKPGGQCQYFTNGKPSCIIGHVLADLGVEPGFDNQEFPDLVDAEDKIESYEPEYDTEDYYNNFTTAKFTNKKDLIFTSEAVRILRTAQEIQDEGGNWGSALETARAAY
jgi:hypothetical protein